MTGLSPRPREARSMDYKEKAQYLAETIAGLGFTTASESAARSALTEAHAAGVAEGEADRRNLQQELATSLNFCRDIRNEIAEEKSNVRLWRNRTAEAIEHMTTERNVSTGALARAEEAEAKLYDTEVKRGQDIMEFEREKKALIAELAAEKAERETAEERGIFVDKRATDMAIEKDALAQELKGARTEAGRMRAHVKDAIESMTATHYALGTVRPDMEKIEGPDWLLIFNAMSEEYDSLQAALSPEPEKPAPDGEGRKMP